MNQISPRLPLSAAQYGIWMGQQMVPDSPAYLTAEAIELNGELDVSAFSQSVIEVLNNAKSLHMRFQLEGEQLWQLPQMPSEAPLQVYDLRDQPNPQAAAQQWMQRSLATLCNPTCDPLYQTALLQTADQQHLWYLQVHHIALDGFGYSLLVQAVAARYSARVQNQPLPALADWSLDKIILAEQNYQKADKFQTSKQFWLQHLAHAPSASTLAAAQEFSDEVIRHSQLLSPAQIGVFELAARQCGQDWGSWMLAAIGCWLAKQSGQRQLTFGLPVMNRLGTPALGVPCMAMNIVPFSISIDPDQDMQTLSKQVADSMRAIRPHLAYRYGWIRQDLGLMDVQKHLFNQAVNLMPFDRYAPFAGLTSLIHPISAGPVKDLNISVSVLNAQWRLSLEANPNAYPAAKLAQLHEDLQQWLFSLAAHPAQSGMASLLQDLPPLSVLHGPVLEQAASPVMQRIMDQALSRPQAIALEHEGVQISYQQLLAKVQTLAARLQLEGLQAEERVVILLPRSPQAIIAILATLWAGAYYVPLDPQGPSSRLTMVLDDAKPRLILSLQCWADKVGKHAALYLDLPSDSPVNLPPPCLMQAEQPAYLLYTSGSTGKPNGVLLGHGALAHFVASAGQLYQISANERILQFAPLHFDASIEEIFLALCYGATLVLRNEAMLDSMATFVSNIEQLQISVLDLPTAFWHELAHALTAPMAAQLAGLRLTIIGGEAAQPERAGRWQALLPDSILLNSYGPTEASIIATSAVLSGQAAVWDGSDRLPIGLPRAGVTVVIVDESLYPVAAGQPGELLICGDALALGYSNQQALSASRFIQLHSLPGQLRAYRTGDRACLQNGQLYFLGRLDHELKISGLRIDPADIENAILSHPAIREVAVVGVERGGLAAYLVVTAKHDGLQAELHSQLADILPMAAIPDHWFFVDHLPRNVNGKIDRKQLACLLSERAAPLMPEASLLEQKIMQVWYQVLGVMPANIHSNFFELGGKSLQAIQVAGQLGRELQRDITVSALFNHNTVHALAKALNAPAAHRPPAAAEDHAFSPLLTIQRGSLPALFCLHPAEGLSWCYLGLARYLPDTAIYGLQATGIETSLPSSFDAMVSEYVQRVRQQQATGPYRLLGWSLGGGLAQAMAVQLQAAGEQVELLALMDSYPVAAWQQRPLPTMHDALVTVLSVNGEVDADSQGLSLSQEAIYQRLLRPGSPLATLGRSALERLAESALHGMQLFRRSQTSSYHGDLLLFHAGQNPDDAPQPASWHPYVQGQFDCVVIDCNHFGMSDPAPMAVIGRELAKRLQSSISNKE